MERKIHRHYDRQKIIFLRTELFDGTAIPKESQKIIEDFDEIINSVKNLSGKQRLSLYGAIKSLSHQMTDERASRRLGYMNDAEKTSAYIRYFMWWNLVRLVRLFANLPKNAFESLAGEASVAIDVGSGPLTIPIALWLARPELRAKKIVWYCLDLSQTVLSIGENIYLSVVAKTNALLSKHGGNNGTEADLPAKKSESMTEPWSIIRVKGPLGTPIKEKADFIACGNVFNEIVQRSDMPTDFLAKKHSEELISYLGAQPEKPQTVLLVEPGDPHSARFISLMRDSFIRKNFLPIAPCTHSKTCPMAGRTNGKMTNAAGKNAKWCNFAFSTEDAPEKLLKISAKAGLSKERASLSFIIAKRATKQPEINTERHAFVPENRMNIRITSDFIRLPEMHKSGYYACSEFGMLLAIDMNRTHPKNGELLQIKIPDTNAPVDEKSGALIVEI